MKRAYETPVAEKVAFRYQEQVAASGTATPCFSVWINVGGTECQSTPTLYEKKNV